MSNILNRLKAANEVEGLDDRIAAILATLPSRGCCKYILADGTVCQRRRVGQSWCQEHRQKNKQMAFMTNVIMPSREC